MKKFFTRYVSPGQEAPGWVQQGKRGGAVVLALLAPGLPQILKKKYVFGWGLIFLFGTGALLALLMSLTISTAELKAFDILYVIATPNSSAAFPTYVASPSDQQQLIPIFPKEGDIQPFYWEIFTICILLYVVCAVISVWEQWKSGNR